MECQNCGAEVEDDCEVVLELVVLKVEPIIPKINSNSM